MFIGISTVYNLCLPKPTKKYLQLQRADERFTKIRTYSYLSNRNRHQRINDILKKMKLPLHEALCKNSFANTRAGVTWY